MKKLSHAAFAAIVVFLLTCILPFLSYADGQQPLLLLRNPSMSKTKIVFSYGGQLWEVPRSGGVAHILSGNAFTTSGGAQMAIKPIFSPDGQWIAFSNTYEYNTDVYVMPAAGGQITRLTWHPGPDIAVGWTPDSKRILFRSHRNSATDPNQLFTVSINGGFPQRIRLNMAESGSFSPDGSQLAYVPNFQWEPFWKDYKGGQHTKIWISRLSDAHTIQIPNFNSNENTPMWVGDIIYFLSDRDGANTLFAYDINQQKAKKIIDNKGFDITAASAGPGGIVYAQFGQLHIYDFATGKTHLVPVTISGNLPQKMPHYQDVSKELRNPDISPNGIRAVFQAHGDIISVPTKEGSVINLTNSSGVMDRNPSWSPDGKDIAYVADRDGEYDLFIRPQQGGKARKIKLGQDNAYYYNLTWSPDSKKILFYDQKLQLWYVDLSNDNPKPVKIKTGRFMQLADREASWSPDGRWIVYTQVMPNYLHAVYIYSLADGKSHEVTNELADARAPKFGTNGKYLYFLASTNTALTHDWLGMTAMEHPVTYQVYLLTLAENTPSPLAPKSGMDTTAGESSARENGNKSENTKKAGDKKVNIDFNGIANRLIALPVEQANYLDLFVGKNGVLYLTKAPLTTMPKDLTPYGLPLDVLRFDLKKKETKTIKRGITDFVLSAKGNKMLYRQGKSWFISDAKADAEPIKLQTKNIHVFVDPVKEWAEMFHDTWRIERSFFYTPNYHGLDIEAAEKKFAHFLPGIASRSELTFLFREMLSYLSVGHMFIRGGYIPKMDEISVGLLGADYKVANNHYQITKIYTGGHWNPHLYAPLAQPGLQVKVGDYILAVNGRPVTADESIFNYFQDLAGQTITLTVGPNPNFSDSHNIIVKTIGREFALRHVDWMDHNKDVVDSLSDGKLAYVYLPDTYWGGFTNFNRYYFAQLDKKGAVIDERFNHGGLIADYIIQYLNRKPISFGVTRWGTQKTAIDPPMQIFGPKVMLINQFSGSGGDALPWYFKMTKSGTLVGERTWGGLVGISGYPALMDGGSVTAPRFAIEGLDKTFPVENHGIAPDVKVWQNPELVRQGHDPQLEKAIQIAMKQLEQNPPKKYERAPWKNFHPKLPPLPGQGNNGK